MPPLHPKGDGWVVALPKAGPPPPPNFLIGSGCHAPTFSLAAYARWPSLVLHSLVCSSAEGPAPELCVGSTEELFSSHLDTKWLFSPGDHNRIVLDITYVATVHSEGDQNPTQPINPSLGVSIKQPINQPLNQWNKLIRCSTSRSDQSSIH